MQPLRPKKSHTHSKNRSKFVSKFPKIFNVVKTKNAFKVFYILLYSHYKAFKILVKLFLPIGYEKLLSYQKNQSIRYFGEVLLHKNESRRRKMPYQIKKFIRGLSHMHNHKERRQKVYRRCGFALTQSLNIRHFLFVKRNLRKSYERKLVQGQKKIKKINR